MSTTARTQSRLSRRANGTGLPVHEPWDVLLVAAAGLLLVGAARMHTLVPGAALLRPAILCAGLGTLAYLGDTHPHRSLGELLKQPLGRCMAFLVIWALVGSPFGMYPGSSVGYAVGVLPMTAVLLVLVAASVRHLLDLRRLLGTYAIGGVVYSAVSMGGAYRGIGTGGHDPNDAAMFVLSAMPLIVYFAIRSRVLLMRVACALGLAACVTAVVRSGSRGGFLAFCAVVLYQLFFVRSIRPTTRVAGVATAVGILAVTAATQPEFWERMSTLRDLDNDYNTTELTGRKQVWKRGLGYMAANPILGVGINNFAYAESQHPAIASRIAQGIGTKFSAPHSIWIQVAAELGVPGIAAFIGAFVICFATIWRMRRRARTRGDPFDHELAEIGEALGGMVVAIAVAGTFLSQAYGDMTWGVLGLCLALFKLARLYGRSAGEGLTPAMSSGKPSPRGNVARHVWRPSVIKRVDLHEA